jgi:hypothetical protein
LIFGGSVLPCVPNVTRCSFAQWMLIKARAEGEARGCAVVATVVSSVAVGKMAQIEGFEFHQTATGFKNIGSKGLELKKQVRSLVMMPPTPSPADACCRASVCCFATKRPSVSAAEKTASTRLAPPCTARCSR